MEKLGSTFAIGFRELFRILVPGLLVLTFFRLEFSNWLSIYANVISFADFIIIAFFIGLIVYILQPYRHVWPWCKAFHYHIGRLADEVRIALGSTAPSFSKDFDSEYKCFLESTLDRSFVERVHYFTSFYYLLVQISVLLFLFALVDVSLIFPRSSLYVHYSLSALLYLAGAWFFHRYSSQQLARIINEQIIMVRLKRNNLQSIQKELESRNLKRILLHTCRSLLNDIVLDPDKRDHSVDCKLGCAQDWRTGLETATYAITIRTAYPISTTGEPGGYKGFYKERIESVLNHIAAFYRTQDRLSKVTVEIVPTKSTADHLESLIPLPKACNNIITNNSPVLAIAKKYDVKYVLVRGRHLVGPNPALVTTIEQLCAQSSIQSALDLFSGTGIVSIVLKKKQVPYVTSVDNGQHFQTVMQDLNTLGGIHCIAADAFTFPFSRPYDLIVADPYYEDALTFLNKRIMDIHHSTNVFVFVCSAEYDGSLRTQCGQILQSQFSHSTNEQLLLGQSIFLCRNQ